MTSHDLSMARNGIAEGPGSGRIPDGICSKPGHQIRREERGWLTVRTADAYPPPGKWGDVELELLSFSSEHFSPADRATLARETYAMIGNIDITDVSGESFRSQMDAVVI